MTRLSPDLLQARQDLQALKSRLHADVMGQINLRLLDQLAPAQLREQIGRIVYAYMDRQELPFNQQEREALIQDIQDEILGYGPIEPLLRDPTVNDILVNTWKQVYVERRGKLEKTCITFQDNEHLKRIIEKIAGAVGRRIDESSPMVDARLPDGSRVNAVIPPLALDGPLLSIRKFAADPYTVKDLVRFRSLTPPMAEFLAAAVKARVNIIISGGTGAGKTTLLNVCSSFIPDNERILTIEDSAELQLQQPHVARLETRPANIEGAGEIRQRDLVKNALRMRPDRIIVGEVRGAEALDMLQAMNTGHDGSLTTIHANTPRDCLTRLEHMVGMTGLTLGAGVVRQQIASAIDLVVQAERLADGRRVVTSIAEITGMEESVVTLQELFTFTRRGMDADGRVRGEFRAAGLRPQMLKRFAERGVAVSDALFDPKRIYE
ncbi:MAG: pilus assembly protein CpaF [Moraxellaceae bacterium]|jgi:pilus assembly protein CpaF|nr:pilus assembly protein CpaF [Moraxellaceae bacterium]